MVGSPGQVGVACGTVKVAVKKAGMGEKAKNVVKARGLRAFLPCFLIILAMLCPACDNVPMVADDLEAARQAVAGHNWLLAERLLERFLAVEDDSDRRWKAWQQLLVVINSGVREPRATIEYLEAMLVEYADDDRRCKLVLESLGQLLEQLRQIERAADVWSTYIGLGGLAPEEMVNGYRHLAAMEFARKRSEAGEESLAQCLAQPFEGDGKNAGKKGEFAKTMCMYDLADHYSASERWQEAVDICHQILDSLPADENGQDRKDPNEVPGQEEGQLPVLQGLFSQGKLGETKGRIRGLTGYLLADSLEQLGRQQEALAMFEQVRQYYPNQRVVENRIDGLKRKMKRK